MSVLPIPKKQRHFNIMYSQVFHTDCIYFSHKNYMLQVSMSYWHKNISFTDMTDRSADHGDCTKWPNLISIFGKLILENNLGR